MERREAESDVHIRLVYRERWRRILVLTGDVDGTLIYNALSHGERVYFQGELVARTSKWSWQNVYPWAEFKLPGHRGDMPCRIDVGATFIFWRRGINRFRFAADGKILFGELYNEYRFSHGSGIVTDEPFKEDY